MHTLTRSDSVVGTPGSGQGSLATSPDGQPMLPGSGMHRGSINGIPGGGLPGATSRSPVKESSFLARSASLDDHDGNNAGAQERENMPEGSVSPPARKEGIPIRT